jgi:hypothetical protein
MYETSRTSFTSTWRSNPRVKLTLKYSKKKKDFDVGVKEEQCRKITCDLKGYQTA